MTRKSRTGLIVLAALTAALGTALAAPRTAGTAGNPLQVSLVPATGAEAGQFLGSLKFTMTNTSKQTVHVLKYQTPFFGVENNLFEVYRGDERVQYTGMYAKRTLPEADDYMTFGPGETKRIVVDLSDNYDMSVSGQYQVKFETVLQNADVGGRMMAKASGGMATLESSQINVWVDGTDTFMEPNTQAKRASAEETVFGVKAAPAPVFEKCTTTQSQQVQTAFNSSKTYAANAKGYFPSQGPRYTTWFGVYNSSRHTTASNHFTAIDSAYQTKGFTFNCGCKKRYYAYVYSNDAYRIYLCSVFWQAPVTGTDSRAGTIVHETSHFTVVAGTDDWAYGQSAAKSLAISDPNKAVDNADSHEYFAENTPAQQ
jgi:peptidyl-Lys metalloendopeptidase